MIDMSLFQWNTPERLHKSMTFQHGCPHHCGPPGRMYFVNMSKKKCLSEKNFVKKSFIREKKVHHVHRGKKIKKKNSLEKFLTAHCPMLSND